tara:strand:+ start:6446 stop:6826 length:381 start_codon:yes stop_codon:yes gene_type:complete
MRNANVVIVVYDVTDEHGLERAENWIDVARRESSAELLVLVGNKIDLVDKRVIAKTDALKVASAGSLLYVETSAKTGQDVDNLFRRVGETLVEISLESEEEDLDLVSVTLDNPNDEDVEGMGGCMC